MKDNQRTPTSAATLAGEAGMTAGARSIPCKQFTTSGPKGQVKIADLLGHGQTAAVPLRHLVAVTGLDGRTVRRMIEKERRAGAPILCNNLTGYYLPQDEAEVTVCVGSLRRRAGEIMRTARAIERAGGGRCG